MIENKLFKDIFSYKGQSSLVFKAKEYLKKHHSLNYKKFTKTQLLTALANPELPVGEKIEGDFVVMSVSMEKMKDQKNGLEDAVVVKILAKNTNQVYVLYFWSTSKISFSKITKNGKILQCGENSEEELNLRKGNNFWKTICF